MHLTLRGDTLRRITKAALGGLAGCALVLGGAQAANALSAVEYYNYPEDADAGASLELKDLQLAAGPFDDARATLRIKETPGDGTRFKLEVQGIDPTVKGDVFGAHLHTGACVEGAGAEAGPHYKTGGVASPFTEVWFDVWSNANGDATFDASAPFVPVDSLATDPGVPLLGVLPSPGVMSIVIHVWPTNTKLNYPNDGGDIGFAGARQACLPLLVPQWNK
jgi:Cu/Zn superoxide dismutase